MPCHACDYCIHVGESKTYLLYHTRHASHHGREHAGLTLARSLRSALSLGSRCCCPGGPSRCCCTRSCSSPRTLGEILCLFVMLFVIGLCVLFNLRGETASSADGRTGGCSGSAALGEAADRSESKETRARFDASDGERLPRGVAPKVRLGNRGKNPKATAHFRSRAHLLLASDLGSRLTGEWPCIVACNAKPCVT